MITNLLKALGLVLIGIAIGIGGEFLIPQKYQINLAYYKCYVSMETGNVFLPRTFMYSPYTDKFPIPLVDHDFNWKSYHVALAFLIGDIETLGDKECQALSTLETTNE